MKKSEVADRVKNLRIKRGETQEQLAEYLGIARPRISEWESGQTKPSPEIYLNLGNLADDLDDKIWFWEQAGLDIEKLLAAAAQVKKSAPEMVTGLLRKLPSDAQIFIVNERIAGQVFSPGDTILLEPASDAHDPQPFWDQIVLLEFAPREQREKGWITESWPTGLFLGRLRCKQYAIYAFLESIPYVATVGPFTDSKEKWFHGDESIVIRYWAHPGPPKEPIPGSERARLQEEVKKAYARCRELWESAAPPSGGGTIHETPEMRDAHKTHAEIKNQLAYAERIEREEAEKEAKLQAPEMIKFPSGVRILGRIIAWFPLPKKGEEKSTK